MTPHKQAPRSVIVGLGNPLRGDDGVGQEILEVLSGRRDLRERADILDGGVAGMTTLLLLKGYDEAVIIDAADIRRPAGEWIRISADDLALPAGGTLRFSAIHEVNLRDVIIIGRTLEMLPARTFIYAVQPLEFDMKRGLSEPVRQSIPGVVQAILNEMMH